MHGGLGGLIKGGSLAPAQTSKMRSICELECRNI